MRKLIENSTLFFIGIISGALGIFLSEVYPITPARSEIVYSIVVWSIFLTIFIIYRAKGRYVMILLALYVIILLMNNYYINPLISLFFNPVLPLLPLILISVAYITKNDTVRFILRSTALSYLGVCFVFIVWLSLFLE